MTRMRPKNLVLVVVVAVMINLPLVHSMSQNRRIEREGIDVTAQVTDHRAVDGEYYLSFTIPSDGERHEVTGQARVEEDTYHEAVATSEIDVRLLPDTPSIYTVEGEVTSRVGLYLTLLADVFLLFMVLLASRYRSRLRPVLVLVATEDLERCPPGSVLDRIEGDRYVVCGEVSTIDDGEVILDLGDRLVRVILDGHENPAGYQQAVCATGHMIA